MHVGEAINKLFKEFADGHAVTIYGTPSPQLVEVAKTHKDVNIKWYSHFNGLELESARVQSGRDGVLAGT
jgi:hypothetical protein